MRNVYFWQVAWSAFLDCLSSRNHSHDFSFYRSEILIERLRMFALLFGLASPVWIPIDRWLLSEHTLEAMMVLRVGMGMALLVLAGVTLPSSTKVALLRVASLVLVTLVFYLVVESLTGLTYDTPGLIGYTVLPVLLVAVLALLPLTLVESLVFQAAIAVAVIGLHHHHGALGEQGVLGLLWILLLFSGFALLAQGIQLHLLMLIHRQATRDNLTGLFNRGALMRGAANAIGQGKLRGASYAVLMVDLDRFKKINDTYGHLVGDQVLRAAAEVLAEQASRVCLPGRFGGEEFMLLMCGTSLPQAMEHAEKIRKEILGLQIQTESGPISVTTSIGVAVGAPGEDIEDVVRRADQALYVAKDSGRNRVVSSLETENNGYIEASSAA